MKILNKVINIVLSLAIVFSLATVIGITEVHASDDFKIDVSGTLTKYTGNDVNITIPKEVKIIGEKAFAGCNSVETVKMSDNVTIIQKSAFDSCTNLKTIKFSKKLNKIGDSAFYGCSSLEKVNLPNKIETIGISAFCNCRSLNGIYLPESLKDIGAHAFGFSMLGGYTQTADFTIVGESLAKMYADKYDFSYINKSYLKIKPISLKKSGKSAAKLTWAKNKKIDKVQIQYSTKSNFAGKKTLNVPNSEVTSKLINNLKKDTAYYVRIRGVKTIAGTTYNSAWSKTKRIIL